MEYQREKFGDMYRDGTHSINDCYIRCLRTVDKVQDKDMYGWRYYCDAGWVGSTEIYNHGDWVILAKSHREWHKFLEGELTH